MDPFLDISLEINRANTLERALQRFTATEYLENDNKYKCPKQACLVRAAKRISIEKAPNVLVIQLKRFEFSNYGQKLTKKVRIPPCHHGHQCHSVQLTMTAWPSAHTAYKGVSDWLLQFWRI